MEGVHERVDRQDGLLLDHPWKEDQGEDHRDANYQQTFRRRSLPNRRIQTVLWLVLDDEGEDNSNNLQD